MAEKQGTDATIIQAGLPVFLRVPVKLKQEPMAHENGSSFDAEAYDKKLAEASSSRA